MGGENTIDKGDYEQVSKEAFTSDLCDWNKLWAIFPVIMAGVKAVNWTLMWTKQRTAMLVSCCQLSNQQVVSLYNFMFNSFGSFEKSQCERKPDQN